MKAADLLVATQGLPDGFILAAFDGRVLAMNTAAADMLGSIGLPSHIDKLGQVFSGIEGPRPVLRDSFRTSAFTPFPRLFLANPQFKTLRFCGRRLDHEMFPGEPFLLVRFHTTFQKEDQFLALNAELERQRFAVERLVELKSMVEKKEQDLRLAVESVNDWTWDWDILTNQMQFHTRGKHVLSYASGRPACHFSEWKSRIHKHDLGSVLEALQAHVEGRADQFSCEYRMRCVDGSFKWIFSRGRVVDRSAAGEPLRMVGIQSDITEHKDMRLQLDETDSSLKALLSGMTDGVMISQNGQCTFSNLAIQVLLQCTEAEMKLFRCEDWVHEHSKPDWEKIFISAQEGTDFARSRHHELQMLSKTGRSLWVELIVSTLQLQGKLSLMIIVRDISQKKQDEQLIWRQANFDFLTDLPNRHLFMDKLENEIKRSSRASGVFSVMFIDLDNFKEINDTQGHEHGDKVLQEISRRLLGSVRESDTVARLGGDEFTLLIPGLSEREQLGALANKILGNISHPIEIAGNTHYVSASIGITAFPEDTVAADELMQNADQAMYSAKRMGRSNFSFFSATMQMLSRSKNELLNDLHRAVACSEFYLAYQPIVNLNSGRIEKAEALIRWQHPVKGVVSPVDFIPISEESGLILPIGEWTFREALRQSRAWRRKWGSKIQISINKSPKQFYNKSPRYKDFLSVVEQSGICGDALALEITESLLLQPEAEVLDKMKRLRELGIEIAVDDFGTGYSSLSYLKKFDVDYLKIDKSFVLDLEQDPDNQALCEAIIVMAHKLGIRVIAEGIETEAQQTILTAAGCDFGQGFFFSRPLKAAQFEQWVLQRDSRFTR